MERQSLVGLCIHDITATVHSSYAAKAVKFRYELPLYFHNHIDRFPGVFLQAWIDSIEKDSPIKCVYIGCSKSTWNITERNYKCMGCYEQKLRNIYQIFLLKSFIVTRFIVIKPQTLQTLGIPVIIRCGPITKNQANISSDFYIAGKSHQYCIVKI